MRVLFIPSWFPSSSNPYAGNFIRRLAEDLSEKEIKICVLNFDYNHTKITTRKHEKQVINKNLIVHRFYGFHIPKANTYTQNKWIKSCIDMSDKIISDWDFDYVHSHDYVGSFVGAEIAKKKDIKHIISLHHSNFIERTIKEWRVEILKDTFKSAYKIITPSTEFTKTINQDYEVNADTIPHYIYWNLYLKNESHKEIKALSITSTEKVKNNKGLIDFCEKNNIEIDIYGDIEKKLIKTVPKNVTLQGKTPFENLQKRYKEYTFLISFSTIETFGLSILEALSHGLPVLVKNKTGGLDLIDKTNGKFIDENFNFNDFISNLSNYNSENISKEIVAKFNKEKVLNKYLDLYDSFS